MKRGIICAGAYRIGPLKPYVFINQCHPKNLINFLKEIVGRRQEPGNQNIIPT